MAKKRAYIYVDVDKYARFKKLLDIMGITMTDFFDQTMSEFIDSMEEVILNQDKEGFLKMMNLNLEQLQKEMKDVKANKE
ncbi:MAG: hypothetical protein ABS882_13870 [Lysinibacillus sp.]